MCYYDDLDLSEYPNLKELTLDFGNDAFDFKHIFCNLYEPLDVLRIKNFNDLDLLQQSLGKMMFAKKIFLYVTNVSENDNIITQLRSNKKCKVVVDNDTFSDDNLCFTYSYDSEEEDNYYYYENITKSLELHSDESPESEDECHIYNDKYVCFNQSNDEENKYQCFMSQEEEGSEFFNFNDFSSDSMDCGKMLFTKVQLTASMCDSECSYECSSQLSPFLIDQLQ